MKASLYNQKGKVVGDIELPESIFTQLLNKDLLHQVVLSLRKNQRKPLAFAKDRSEARGGGKKPWRQKGTGRARHGSIRSPLWKGGGVTFGPRLKEQSLKRKINLKVKKAAFRMVFTQKLNDEEIKFIDKINLKEPKTKEVNAFFQTLLPGKKQAKTVLILESKHEDIKRGARNISHLNYMTADNMNLLDLLNNKYLFIVASAIPVLEKKLT